MPDAAARLDAQSSVSLNRLNEIVLGVRGITAATALRLARLLKMSSQLWMRLQADWIYSKRCDGMTEGFLSRAVCPVPVLYLILRI